MRSDIMNKKCDCKPCMKCVLKVIEENNMGEYIFAGKLVYLVRGE